MQRFLHEVSIQKARCNELTSTVSAPIPSKVDEKGLKKSNAKIHGTIFQLLNSQVLLIYVESSDRGVKTVRKL